MTKFENYEILLSKISHNLVTPSYTVGEKASLEHKRADLKRQTKKILKKKKSTEAEMLSTFFIIIKIKKAFSYYRLLQTVKACLTYCYETESAFTTLHFLHNFLMGPIR